MLLPYLLVYSQIKHKETEKEISLRREIGPQTDRYFINKKKESRNEIVNLLEQAGFSSDNPYYIVKQGKVPDFPHFFITHTR